MRCSGWLDRGWMLAVALALLPSLAFARQQHGPEAAAKYKAQADELKGDGKGTEALRYYKASYEADTTNIGNGEDYAKELFAAKKYEDAAKVFRELVDRNDPAAAWNLAYALRKTGDYAGAAQAYAAYEKIAPEDPDAYFMLAECLRKLNRYQEAADQYDLYAQKETRSSESDWVAKAKQRSSDMKTAAAQPVNAATAASAPAGGSVTISMPVGDTSAAATPTPAPAPAPVAAPTPAPQPVASTRDPNAAITRIKDGDVLFKQGRYQEALAAYQDAVKLDDQGTNAILKEGLALANMGYYRDAVANWQRVLQIDPSNAYAPKYIAKAQPRIDPNAPSYDPTAAHAVQATGDTGAAVVVTASAAPAAAPTQEATPEDAAAARESYKTAVQQMAAQQYDAAIALLNTAIQKNPAYTNAYIARGGAYFGQHKYPEAVADYQKAMGLTNALATPLYGLARAYDRLGDKTTACGYYQRYAASTSVDVQANLRKQAEDRVAAGCQ